jgi:predicted deacylase
VLLLRTLADTLAQLRAHHRRRIPFLTPAVERRRPRIAAEDYAARHTIEHTLDRKADLRRLAPLKAEAAERYAQLLQYELTGLCEVVAALETTAGGRDLQECLAEAREEIARLEIEVEWCHALLTGWPTATPVH